MNPNKILGITFVLFGIVFILFGAATLLFLSVIGNIITNTSSTGFVSVLAPLNTVITIGWFMGIVELAAGIMAIISAVLLFTSEE
ncbi:MAG: hypothetical protein V1802_00360 [Candidatus Aenigmatarchaeota archaeon]